MSDDLNLRSHRHSKSKRRLSSSRLCRTLIVLLKDIILLSLALPTALTLFRTGNSSIISTTISTSNSAPPTSCDCGANTTQALSLNCKYDSLAAAWLPPHCRDDALTAEFERSGDGPNGEWQYWADTKHTQLLTLDEVAALADQPGAKFHMSNHWHAVHCIFYWRKEHRASLSGGHKIVEPRSDNEGHIKHCGDIFLKGAYGTVAGVSLNTDHGHFETDRVHVQ